jgi:flagellin-specific chaperone FliS
MLPYRAYQQQRDGTTTRIDLLLGLFEKALARLDRAEAALGRSDLFAARTALAECQIMVSALAAGSLGRSDEMSLNFVRLYEFVTHRLQEARVENIHDARRILASMRDTFEAIRPEALRLEREGALPPLAREHSIQATA